MSAQRYESEIHKDFFDITLKPLIVTGGIDEMGHGNSLSSSYISCIYNPS